MVSFSMQVLHHRLMSLLGNHRTSSLTYQPCGKCLKKTRKPLNCRFSILDDKQTFQSSGNASRSRLEVAIWTRPHPEKHCLILWWQMLSAPSGPSATNHINCLLIAVNRRHRKCCCIVPNVFSILERTETLIMIDVLCEVGKSLETPSNVIL